MGGVLTCPARHTAKQCHHRMPAGAARRVTVFHRPVGCRRALPFNGHLKILSIAPLLRPTVGRDSPRSCPATHGA